MFILIASVGIRSDVNIKFMSQLNYYLPTQLLGLMNLIHIPTYSVGMY